MKKWAKRIGIALAALLIIFIGLGVYGYYSIRQDEMLDGELTGNDVSAPVKLVRDENYIVHVIAQNDTDLYYGLGYAMAQDRLAMMDILRRVSEGRLSEWVGDVPFMETVDASVLDRVIRALEFEAKAKAGVEKMAPGHRKLLTAFTKGINAYIDDVKDDPPFEYKLFRSKPEPWREFDSLAIPQLFGMGMLEINFYTEWMLEVLSAKFGDEFALKFLTKYPDNGPIITAANMHKPGPSFGGPIYSEFARVLRTFSMFSPRGSNNWVVAGSLTKSGKPMLANDPHVPLNPAPTFWYHVHLKSDTHDVQGMMFPGFPGFGAGSNRKIAWGLTNIMVDQVDLFKEKINPDNPNQYEYEGKFEDFKTLEGKLNVRGREPLDYKIRVSRHGPIIDEGMLGGLIKRENMNEVLAIKTHEVEMGRFIGGYMDLNKADNWKEYTAALKEISVGPVGWNQIYADVDGNIGYWAAMKLPIRYDNQGAIVRDGTKASSDWAGYVPFEMLPHSYNPQRGYIVTANNRNADESFPYYISSDYEPPYRAARIIEMITWHPDKPLTTDDFIEFQKDVSVLSARKNVPIIISEMYEKKVTDPLVKKCVQLLKDWQAQGYKANVESGGAAVYGVLMRTLEEEVFSDELGDIKKLVLNSPAARKTLDAIFADKGNSFWDDTSTKNNVETRGDIIERAMGKSTLTLKEAMGDDTAKWSWGDIHKLWIGHPFGIIPLIGGPMKIGIFRYPGSEITVNMGMGFEMGGRFNVVVGPSSRLIVDLADTSKVLFNSSSGMSGNPFSDRFDNITDKWLKHEYLSLELDEDKFMANKKAVLILKK